MVFGRRNGVRWIGLALSIVICNLWSALFAVAAFTYEGANLTASVAYGGYGALSALLLGFMLVHERPFSRED